MPDQQPIAACVARNVRALRAMRGWSAERLATEMSAAGIGWNRGVVTKLETGRRESVSADETVMLARIFSVTLDDLVRQPPDCPRCHGTPPFGFTCNTCGKIGER